MFRGRSLPEGFQTPGPALIEETDTVVWLEAGDSLEVDADGNYHIRIGAAAETDKPR